jgi:hypothetical protein
VVPRNGSGNQDDSGSEKRLGRLEGETSGDKFESEPTGGRNIRHETLADIGNDLRLPEVKLWKLDEHLS